MVNYTWDQVIAWLGLVVPFCALAWAAVQHVRNEKREQEHLEYKKFFEIMRELGSKDSTVPGNMAAVYELRRFPKYKEVIIRLCNDAPLEGSAVKLLAAEMELTAEYLRSKK